MSGRTRRSAASQALAIPPVVPARPQTAPESAESLRLSVGRTTVRQGTLECWAPMRARKGPVTVPLRCKQWGCPDCGPWLKRRLRRSIVRACEGRRGLRRFYTLTLPSQWHKTTTRGGTRVRNPSWNGCTLQEAYAEISRVWSKFHKRVERKTGHRLSYGSVREPHKDGTPHIHGLIDDYFPRNKLEQWWYESGGGYSDIRLVETQRVSAYLSKYLSKDGNPPPKGCRKYATGGGVKFEDVRPPRPPPAAVPSGWVIEKREVDGSWHRIRDRGKHNWPGLQEALQLHVELERLRDVADQLVVCVVCGGDHDVHS